MSTSTETVLQARQAARSRPRAPGGGDSTPRGIPLPADQFRQYFQRLAAQHAVRRPRGGRAALAARLRQRLAAAKVDLDALQRSAVRAAQRREAVAPAVLALLENLSFIEEHLAAVQHELVQTVRLDLPLLAAGAAAGLPRVYDLAREVIARAGRPLSGDAVEGAVTAYQSRTALMLGELGALPDMLRLVLLEQLGRISARWAAPAQNTTDRSPRREASAVKNCIAALRSLDALSWREFVERQSAVEAVLRRDPLGIYGQMQPKSRHGYRKVVEQLARRCGLEESQVASAAVELADIGRGNASGAGHPLAGRMPPSVATRSVADTTGMKERHVGFFLVDRGRRALEDRIGYRPVGWERVVRVAAAAPLTSYLGAIVAVWLALTFGACVWGISCLLPLAGMPALVLTMIAFAGIAAECSVRAVNCLTTMFVKPRPIMRLDFSTGIPDDCRTLVAVPTMLTSVQTAVQLAADLEIRYLANRNDNLGYALVTDFADADAEALPDDVNLLGRARGEIRRLNAQYGDGGAGPFYLLHRPRRWNAAEGKWMGEERKRGKLAALNHLLRGDGAEFSLVEGDLDFLPSVRYVITLDTDTQLPPGTAREMIEAMAHPLNRPRIDRAARTVVEGHALLQPRVGTTIPAARRSIFAQLFAGEGGVDPYTQQTSDVYQDVFGEGSFIGKGIYDVDAFQTVFEHRFPANRVLSHDLIEGCFARSGLIDDVELFEGFPAQLPADMGRRHRWIRGDWQIAAWLGRRVPAAQKKVRSPLSPLSRWKIFDNLRRSLTPIALLAFLLTGWIVAPGLAGSCLLLAMVVSIAPDLLGLLPRCIRRPAGTPWRLHFKNRAVESGRLLCRESLHWAVLPYVAACNFDAIARALYRLRVSRRKLLEWTVSSDAERTCVTDVRGYFRLLWACPLAAALAGAWLVSARPAALLTAWPVLGAWLLAPLAAWRISQPRCLDSVTLAAAHERNVRRWARRTWHFFDAFVNEESHWLPPDNVQWDLARTSPSAAGEGRERLTSGKVAQRTSPTNIGLGLLANLAAYDLGYLSASRLIERTGRTLRTMVKLECHRGHFLNWYDTRTLQPVGQRYVSTVDSGNLCGALLTMSAGLDELPDRPLVGPQFAQGFLDTLDVLAEVDGRFAAARDRLARRASAGRMPRRSLGEDASKRRSGFLCGGEAMRLVAAAESAVARLKMAARSAQAHEWIAALQRQCDAAHEELERLAFWLDDDRGAGFADLPPASAAGAEAGRAASRGAGAPTAPSCHALASDLLAAIDRAERQCTLRRLPEMAEEVIRLAGQLAAALKREQATGALSLSLRERAEERGGECRHNGPRRSPPALLAEKEGSLWAALARLERRAARAAAAAREQLAEIESLSTLCRDLAEADYHFLYNSQRKLLSIGYNVTAQRRDGSCYDLLASEARLASYLAVSDGQLPAEHWSALGRSVALHGGAPTLLSWSGSMFEYLMPALVMPSHATTLLEASCRGAVGRQIEHARQRGLPWGVSESCFDERNDDNDYYYRAFGVPGLRLERRVDRGLVIAPYASALATMIAPAAACDNLSRLEEAGALCAFGFYDAMDYTAADMRCRPSPCRTVMAHHSGMALVAFANVLLGAPMRRRLMSNPRLQAYGLLLQQRTPQMVQPVDWRKREETVQLLARLEEVADRPDLCGAPGAPACGS